MNVDLMIEIADLALSVANSAMHGGQPPSSLTSTLLQILQKGALAYEQHTGEPLDPSLIRSEANA